MPRAAALCGAVRSTDISLDAQILRSSNYQRSLKASRSDCRMSRIAPRMALRTS